MPSSIRAAVNRAAGEPLTVESLVLADPGPDEVRVRLAASAICHSDVSYIDGAWDAELPAVWGHEATGAVVAVGTDAMVAIGDQVVVTLVRSCGTCRYCLAGRSVACSGRFALDECSPLATPDGEVVNHGLGTAAFAEEVVVHTSQVVAIPADIPPTSAALLGCGVVTGVGAVTNTAEVEAGSSVVVVGCGGVGLNVVQGAAIAGADPILAVDIEPSKLDMAKRLGATQGVDPSATDPAELVAEVTSGAMSDYVFVAAASEAAFARAMPLVGPTGAMVLVGMPPAGVGFEIDPGLVAAANQRILGSKMGTTTIARDIPELVTRYQKGTIELDSLVTGTFALDDINRAIDEVRAGVTVRNVVVFEG